MSRAIEGANHEIRDAGPGFKFYVMAWREICSWVAVVDRKEVDEFSVREREQYCTKCPALASGICEGLLAAYEISYMSHNSVVAEADTKNMEKEEIQRVCVALKA